MRTDLLQAPGIAQSRMLLVQFLQFMFAQVQGLQFLGLVTQEIQFRRPVPGGLLEFGQSAPGLVVLVVESGHGPGKRLVTGILVQQAPLIRASEQGLVGVLAVDIHQSLAQFLERLDRYRAAVDKGPGSAVAHQDTAQDALAGVVQGMFGEPVPDLVSIGGVEHGGNLGPLAAGANHGIVRPVPQRQPQGIDEDGLTRAGFSGESAHSRPKAQLH